MIRTGLFVLAAAALVACNPAKLEVRMPLDQPVSRVSLVVKAVDDASSMRPDELSSLRSTLTSALATRGVTVVPSDEPGAPRLEGQVEVYDRGSSWGRWFAPFFPRIGSGYFQSTWVVRNAAGRMIGACHIDGRVARGPFDDESGIEEMVDHAGTRLSEFLQEAR